MEAKKVELAYIAGILDGEGSIYTDPHWSKQGLTRYNIVVDVRMTDKSALEFIQALFGGRIHCAKRAKQNWKSELQWKVSGERACEVLLAIKPYLLTKRAQAELALKLLEIHQRYKRYTPMERFLQEANALAIKRLNKKGLDKALM